MEVQSYRGYTLTWTYIAQSCRWCYKQIDKINIPSILWKRVYKFRNNIVILKISVFSFLFTNLAHLSLSCHCRKNYHHLQNICKLEYFQHYFQHFINYANKKAVEDNIQLTLSRWHYWLIDSMAKGTKNPKEKKTKRELVIKSFSSTYEIIR